MKDSLGLISDVVELVKHDIDNASDQNMEKFLHTVKAHQLILLEPNDSLMPKSC